MGCHKTTAGVYKYDRGADITQGALFIQGQLNSQSTATVTFRTLTSTWLDIEPSFSQIPEGSTSKRVHSAGYNPDI